MNLSKIENLILKIMAYCVVPLLPRDLAKILEQQFHSADVVSNYNSLRERGALVIKGNNAVVRPDMVLSFLAEALKEKDFIKIIPELTRYEKDRNMTFSSYRLLRDLFIDHYHHNITHFDFRKLGEVQYRVIDYYEYFEAVVGDDEFEWLFIALGERALYSMLRMKLLDIHADLLPVDHITRFDQKLREIPGLVVDGYSSHMIAINDHMLNGQFEQMEPHIKKFPDDFQKTIMPAGIYDLYKGDAEKAFRRLHQTMTSKKKTEMFINYEIFYNIYYILSLLGMDARLFSPEAHKMLDKKGTNFNYSAIVASAMMYHALGLKKEADEAMSQAEYFITSISSLDLIFMYIAACFTEKDLISRHLAAGEKLLNEATVNGYKLLALELSFALSKIYKNEEFERCYKAL